MRLSTATELAALRRRTGWRWWQWRHRWHRDRGRLFGRHRRWRYVEHRHATDLDDHETVDRYRLRRGRPCRFVKPPRVLLVEFAVAGPYEEVYVGTDAEPWWALRLLRARERRGITGDRPQRRLYISSPLQRKR